MSADCPKRVIRVATRCICRSHNARLAYACAGLQREPLFKASAQDAPELILSNTQIETRPDGFGGDTRVVTGEVFNHGEAAYRNISITVEAFDADEELIGEGFGYLVDACGSALLDYALPPGRTQAFEAPYEIFAAGEAALVKTMVEAEATAPAAAPLNESPLARQIAAGEVVALEWLDEETLIFGLGCDDAVFTELDWWQYHAPDHALKQIEHPDAHRVTPEMIERSAAAMITQSGDLNPELYFGSQMTFSPTARASCTRMTCTRYTRPSRTARTSA